MVNLNISFEQLRLRVINRYGVEEMCEMMELTPEDIFDAHWQPEMVDRVQDVLTELDYDTPE